MTPRLKIAAVALTGAIAVVVVAIVLVVTGGRTPAAAPTPSTLEPSSSSSSPAPRPTPTPRPTVSPVKSATETAAAKRSAGEAVAAFVDAWLDDSTARSKQLEDTATPHLAELLAETDPTQIPDTTRSGDPKQVTLPDYEKPETAGEARRYRQSLGSGDAVLVDVITDPDRGWIAAAILPA